jgi:hypothetical protein
MAEWRNTLMARWWHTDMVGWRYTVRVGWRNTVMARWWYTVMVGEGRPSTSCLRPVAKSRGWPAPSPFAGACCADHDGWVRFVPTPEAMT